MMWWRICLNQELEQEEEIMYCLVLLCACLKTGSVWCVCVCVCVCMCVSECVVCVCVCMCVWVSVWCVHVCVCMCVYVSECGVCVCVCVCVYVNQSTCIPFCVFSVYCLFYYQVTRQLLHSSVFMSLTWRDSLSVRRCASIAAAIIEKVQYTQLSTTLLHEGQHNWQMNLSLLLSHINSLFLPLLSLSLTHLPLPSPSFSPPPPSPSYRLHLKKTCTSNYWSKCLLVSGLCTISFVCVSKSVLYLFIYKVAVLSVTPDHMVLVSPCVNHTLLCSFTSDGYVWSSYFSSLVTSFCTYWPITQIALCDTTEAEILTHPNDSNPKLISLPLG